MEWLAEGARLQQSLLQRWERLTCLIVHFVEYAAWCELKKRRTRVAQLTDAREQLSRGELQLQ